MLVYMSDVIISVERLSKKYRLGEIGVDSLRSVAERFLHRVRGRDPREHMGKIGIADRGSISRGEKRKDVSRPLQESLECTESTEVDGNEKSVAGVSAGAGGTSKTPATSYSVREISSSASSLPSVALAKEGARDSSSSDFWALRDVSFEVKRGEVLGIIGRNGAGKSTLLKILSRITEPTSGRAVMRGRVGSLLEVGTGFHPELTGRENIFLNGAILGMKKKEIEKKFDEIVAFSEVEKFIDTPVKRYSSGMYVRLAFAVAAHLEPEILVVDEVLAVGDARFQRKCLGKMGDVAKQGRTVLFVSHNMAAVINLCHRTLLMERGAVNGCGSTTAMVGQYLDEGGGRQGSFVDLWHSPKRIGVGQFGRFVSLSLFSAEGRPIQTIFMGESLTLQLNVQFFQAVVMPEIGFAISTSLGQRITRVVAAWEGFVPSVKMGMYCFRATLPQVLLVPGVYNITVWEKRLDERGGAADDMVDDALRFEVMAAPIKGRLVPFESYCQPGEVYIETQWTCEAVRT